MVADRVVEILVAAEAVVVLVVELRAWVEAEAVGMLVAVVAIADINKFLILYGNKIDEKDIFCSSNRLDYLEL